MSSIYFISEKLLENLVIMGGYKRKSDRKLVFTEEILQEIKERIQKGESKRSIAQIFGVNEATLRKRLKAGTIPTSLGRFKPVFSNEMEQELADYCVELQQMFYGLTLKALCILAYDYAEKNGLQHRFNQEARMAGRDWAIAFCKRRNLSLRQPEKTSLARASGFNKIQIGRFFENLKKTYREKAFPASRIYNMDETSVLTVPNKLPKVLSQKGKKTVGKIVSSERGQLITGVCCMSAGGKFVPPALIFPRKKRKAELIDGAPPGTLLLTSDSGFITSDLFVEWLQHFKQQENVSKENPALIILDNHSTHISITAIEKCREFGIHLLSLPPHSSHKLQPLDRGFFGPLKTAYSQECDKWHVSHPGRAITQYQIGKLFGSAYNRIASIEKAVKSFESCGIWPYNADIFTEEDFAPAIVTERPPPPQTSDQSLSLKERNETEVPVDPNLVPSGNEGSSNQIGQPASPKTPLKPNESGNSPGPSRVSPREIHPPPKLQHTEEKRKRKCKQSEVLTSSPYKRALEEQKKSGNSLKDKKGKTLKKKKLAMTSEKDSITCPLCGETYEDPPKFDWIMCDECNKWWHEHCTTYSGRGIFVCDDCE